MINIQLETSEQLIEHYFVSTLPDIFNYCIFINNDCIEALSLEFSCFECAINLHSNTSVLGDSIATLVIDLRK